MSSSFLSAKAFLCFGLLAAAMAGFLELRPEGGIKRLSEQELLVCPEGPHGTRLSWARRTEMVAR